MSEDVLALIPARGGSKSIPRKNIMEVAGKPLLAWSIDHALRSSRITRTIVSTDDEEIASVARRYGAEVPFLRPGEFAGDLSPDVDVFRHALEFLLENEGYEPEMVVHLRPTGPVRRVGDIDAAVDLLAGDLEADAVRSVSVVHQSPFKMWRMLDDGTMEPLLRLPGMVDCQSSPRQLLPLVYWQNGYVDVLRPRAVLESGSMWGERVLPFIVDTGLFDLDYPEDVKPVEQALVALDRTLESRASRSDRHPV